MSLSPPDAEPEATRPRGLLFTAFEPSGDDHAASVIAELKHRHPDVPVYGWGGPKMRRAGAEIIAETGRDAVMGVPGIKKILEHRQINRDIAAWLDSRKDVRVHVPVDSPAANFPVCEIAKKRGLRVVHLVAPQMWAWGTWRVKKLRRLSDLVLCLLPFEPEFFRSHGVPARFIGHPLFDDPVDTAGLAEKAAALPSGDPKLALLPGSRPGELRRNFPVMLSVFRSLRERHPQLSGVVAAANEHAQDQLYTIANGLGGFPKGLDMVTGDADLVINWCDAAIVVSGTVTLQVAKQARPMVIVYKVSKLKARVFGPLITPPYFTLPNLVVGREIIPELVPYFNGPERLLNAAASLLRDPLDQEAMRACLRVVAGKFAGKRAACEAADAIGRVAGLVPDEPDDAESQSAMLDSTDAAAPQPAPTIKRHGPAIERD
ncbi:MAG: hypothetical protein AAGI30_06280 [Planctomycetota bacterium]